MFSGLSMPTASPPIAPVTPSPAIASLFDQPPPYAQPVVPSPLTAASASPLTMPPPLSAVGFDGSGQRFMDATPIVVAAPAPAPAPELNMFAGMSLSAGDDYASAAPPPITSEAIASMFE